MRIGFFFYQTGFKSRADAEEGISDLYAVGEIDRADQPRVSAYTARNGKRRFGIELCR